ncbi:MAG: histidine kinase, partial [Chitinophagaceae bacterium]|nr:histidine kinase [Chitinophagaceae bacterium]
AYKLEGYDQDWIDAEGRNDAIYSNVTNGKYVFKVKATNKKGDWGEEETAIAIHIVPPFWKTWWFYLLNILFVLAVAYGFYRYRINDLLKRQAIRNKIAQDLHDNVGSTLSSIAVYSQVAKIYNQQHKQEDLKNVLEKIGSASGEMIGEMSDTVWAINPANDHMGTIVQKMESFARPLLAAKEIKFLFTYDPTIVALNLEMTKRKNFYLIFKEAVNNALKYSECKMITVSIYYQHHKMTLRIEDDGKGIQTISKESYVTTPFLGNGLINMKRRAEEMNGSCHIKTTPGGGTTIILEFPIA